MGIENADIYKEGIDTVLNTDIEALRDEKRKEIQDFKEAIGPDLEKNLGIGKIINRKAGNIIIGKDGFAFVDDNNEVLGDSVFRNGDEWPGKFLDVFSDGRVIFENGIGIRNPETGKIAVLHFSDFGIKKLKYFRDDGLLVGDNVVLDFDLKTRELLFDSSEMNLGKIEDIIKDDMKLRVIGSKGMAITALGGSGKIKIGPGGIDDIVAANTIDYNDLGIGLVISTINSIFANDEGIFILGTEGAVKLTKNLTLEYTVKDTSDIGTMFGISKDGFILGTHGIKKIDKEGKEIFKYTTKELGLGVIHTIGRGGKIVGYDEQHNSKIISINMETGEKLYDSSQLDEETINELKTLGITDIDRFGNERFINHILKNRQNISNLGDRPIILLAYSQLNLNQSLSTDNIETLMYTHDVLYYEIGGMKSFEDMLIELMTQLPKKETLDLVISGNAAGPNITLGLQGENIDDIFFSSSDLEFFDKYSDLFKGRSITLKTNSSTYGIQEMIAKTFGNTANKIISPTESGNSSYSFGRDFITRELNYDGVKFSQKTRTIQGSKVK